MYNSSRVEAISSLVRTERPGNYLFKIQSFSFLVQALSKTNRDKYDSPHFDAGGYKWKLTLYPNGDKKRGGDGHISLYLALAEPNKSPPKGEEVRAIFKFFVFDHLNDNYLVLQDGKERRFHALKTEWGIANLLSLRMFNDPYKGYLVDDCCAFGVEIHINKIERQGGLFLSKKNLSYNEGSFNWKIDKFSTLKEIQNSKEFSVNGVKWTLQLHPKGDSRGNGKGLSLFLCVHDYSSFPRGWSIYAEYKVSILDQLNARHLERTTVNGNWFDITGIGYGWSEFMQLSELNNASRGFIVNDAVAVEVKLTCFSVVNRLP